MSCKVKDCGFISNCPEMMEYHMSSAHCTRITGGKRRIGQNSHVINASPSINTMQSTSSEPDVKISVVHSPGDIVPPDEKVIIFVSYFYPLLIYFIKKPRLQRVTSPEKRPRNIKIGIDNVLNLKEANPNNLNIPDNVLLKLLLVKMYQCPHHSWESVCGDDGNIDPRSSVIKSLVLDHLGGCEPCQELVEKEEIIKSRFDLTDNHSVAFLKNQILCHLKHIQALKEEVRQLHSEIEGLSNKKYDLSDSLQEISKPRVQKEPFYSTPKGFRLIDTNLMSLALSNAQTCQHNT